MAYITYVSSYRTLTFTDVDAISRLPSRPLYLYTMSYRSTQPALYIFTGTNDRVHCTTAYNTFSPHPTLFTNNAAYKTFRETSSLLSTLQHPKQNSTTIPKPTDQHNTTHLSLSPAFQQVPQKCHETPTKT